MARTLKTRGMQELNALRNRVRRQHALGRIGKVTAFNLVDLLNKAEAIILSCRELNENGEEEG